ncbi:MAG: glycosyltransferase family 2 protein [Desulfobacterales bacterium]
MMQLKGFSVRGFNRAKPEKGKQDLLVSIVTPSYNQGEFIEETILSVKNQGYSNLEHIIVDGGSEDGTLEVLKKYEDTYNMRWISEEDEGHSDAVNKGFNMARGEIIGWLNSDDVYTNTSVLRSVVKTFCQHPDVDVVYGDELSINEDSTILRVQCSPRFSYHRLLQWCFLDQPAVFFRKRVTQAHHLDVRLKVAIDYEYWLRIGKEYRFFHLSKVLAADRNHAQRISEAREDELRQVSEQICKQYGKKYDLFYYLTRSADMVFSGLPRRVKGLFVLMMLRRKKDWAFPAEWDGWLASVNRQLFKVSSLRR